MSKKLNPKLVRKLELHYFFDDRSHTMDAVIRNECEKELLALFYECSSILGVGLKVESEAFQEGGLKEIWNFFGTPQVASAIAVLALILSRYPLSEGIEEKHLRELQTTEATLNIKKLRLELKKLNHEDPKLKDIKKIAKKVSKDSKIIVRRSNFFEKLEKYPKVESISYQQLDTNNKPVGKEKSLKRNKFNKFIIHSLTLKPEITDSAEIEIVAPVLKEGNYKWKGIYKDEPLSFTMKDANFKQQVLSKSVSFQNGATIIAVLESHRKLDETGNIVITGYSVSTVIGKYDERQTIETTQGKEFKQAKAFSESQNELFE